jgi:hypothetical protein
LQGINDKGHSLLRGSLGDNQYHSVSPSEDIRGMENCTRCLILPLKECRSEYFLLQKLNYIPKNLISGKWHICDHPIDYVHSFGGFYLTGEEGGYPVFNYAAFIDIG